MPDQPPGSAPRPMTPPLKNVQYINTPVNITDPDGVGTREISFVTSPVEQHSYTLAADAQVAICKILIEQFDNDQKRDLMAAMAPGIEVVQTVPRGESNADV